MERTIGEMHDAQDELFQLPEGCGDLGGRRQHQRHLPCFPYFTNVAHRGHGDPISNFAVLVTNLAQGPSLGEGERWSQIRLELPLEQEGGKQIRLELPS